MSLWEPGHCRHSVEIKPLCDICRNEKQVLQITSRDARIKGLENLCNQLREALGVAREALVGIAAEHLSFPDAPTSWTKEELLEVVCTDTDIARETLAAIKAVLQGSSGENV